MLVYVVTGHKWGSLEGHSYICGVFSNREDAEIAANKESIWKEGRYDFLLSTLELNDATICGRNLIDSEWIKCANVEETKRLIDEEYIKSLSHTF